MEPELQNKEQEPMEIPEEELTIPGRETDEVDTSPAMAIILGLLVVAAAVIFAGLYLWGGMLKDAEPTAAPVAERPTDEENNEPESTRAEAEVETMSAMSTSDDLASIEADLDNTMLNDLDAELNAIDAEFDAAERETQ